MSIMTGGKEPTAIKVGTQDVKAVYAGTEKVWPAEVTGGNDVYEKDGYRYHKFTQDGSLTVANAPITVDYIIVGGGGGAGCIGAGGGAGEALTGSMKIEKGNHPVVIGEGGAAGTSPTSVAVDPGLLTEEQKDLLEAHYASLDPDNPYKKTDSESDFASYQDADNRGHNGSPSVFYGLTAIGGGGGGGDDTEAIADRDKVASGAAIAGEPQVACGGGIAHLYAENASAGKGKYFDGGEGDPAPPVIQGGGAGMGGPPPPVFNEWDFTTPFTAEGQGGGPGIQWLDGNWYAAGGGGSALFASDGSITIGRPYAAVPGGKGGSEIGGDGGGNYDNWEAIENNQAGRGYGEDGKDAAPNTGSGGGGASERMRGAHLVGYSGSGSDGVVIVRYKV